MKVSDATPGSMIAVNAIRQAANQVSMLRDSVDPGHVPMGMYLSKLEKKLREQADELESRCRKESGG